MAIENALQGGFVNGVLHFGSFFIKKNIDIVKTVLEKMGASEDLIEFVPDRLGHDRMYSLDCSKTTKLLGWKQEQNFEEGITIVIEDVRQRFYGKAY
jgi:dTDP-glucose 4,6-dehydratase